MTTLDQQLQRRGMMVIVSAPSGTGKTTLCQALLREDPGVTVSISATTRAPRPGEVHGKDYLFITPEEFHNRVAADAFLEYAEVFGNFYGTPKAPVETALAAGHDILFDIDWQGAEQLIAKMTPDCVTVFVLPPSKKTLLDRLHKRGQDTDDVIAHRMNQATEQMGHWRSYQYCLINDDFDATLHQLNSIIIAERTRSRRLHGLKDFVDVCCA